MLKGINIPYKRMFPDSPIRTRSCCLKGFGLDHYKALAKMDGFRCITEIDENGNVSFISKSGNPLPVSNHVQLAVKKLIDDKKIPIKSSLDGEWMKRRPDYDGPECIYIFGPIWLNGEWVGHLPFKDRWEWTLNLGLKVDDLSIARSDQIPNIPLIIPAYSVDCADLFEKSKNAIRTEGIVIYDLNGIIAGNPVESKDTRAMLKCKWREGDSGRTCVA